MAILFGVLGDVRDLAQKYQDFRCISFRIKGILF